MFASGKWLTVALLAFGVAACDESPVTLPEPTSITAAAAEIKLMVGDVATVPNQVLDQQGQVIPGVQPTFTSDNPSVAAVDATGTVRAMSAGSANITAAYGGVTATSKVTVAARPVRTPATIAMPTGEIRLVPGDAVSLPGQLLDQSGQVMEGLRPSFSSSNPSVVSVDANGSVRALSTGTADITARYGTLTATVKVTVGNDLRSFTRSLDVLADSVAADIRVGSQAVAIRAFNGLGQPVCPAVTVQFSDPSVALVTQNGCSLVVTPRFAGRTTVRVSADDVSDTFVVNVTSTGMTALFSSRPASSALFAGNTVSYSVRVLNSLGSGIAGHRVAFDVSAGTLSASSATTDSAGYATVQWTLPTNLRQLGNTQWIGFSTVLPNGVVSARFETVFINGAAAASLTLYRRSPQGSLQAITTSSITLPAYSDVFLGARAEDQYGNIRVEDFSLTLPGAFKYAEYQSSDGIEYAEFYTSAPKTTTFTVTGGGVSKSVSVVIE